MSPQDPTIRTSGKVLEATWGGISVACPIPESGLPVAHLGCQNVKNAAKKFGALPRGLLVQLDVMYGANMPQRPEAVPLVVSAIANGIAAADLRGAVLVDTMRSGSDYWRPGKLFGEVADSLRNQGLEVSHAREDALCPSGELLDRFRSDTAMCFAAYAHAYEQELLAGEQKSLRIAAYLTASALARKLLPVFYCTDPYIPGYAAPLQISATPFANRVYPVDPHGFYREVGCHRVVLAECLGRCFRSLGVAVVCHELDANAGMSHRRAM
jgi:hypothetical protein